jgi:hypothetical protein
VLANAMNANPQVTTRLLNYLSPAAVAAVVNVNQEFLRNLIGYLDPKVITQASEGSAAFVEGLMTNLDERVIGGVVNNRGSFLSTLVGSLDTNRLAAAINANPEFLRLMIANMDAKGMADMQHAVHLEQGSDDIVGRLLAAIHVAGAEGALASAINSNGQFLADVMGGQDPKVLADVVNRADVSGVPNGLIMQLIPLLNPVVLAQAMNAHPAVTGQLLANLDITVISNALNANPNLLPDLLAIVDPALLTQTLIESDDHVMKHLAFKCRAKAKVPILQWMTAEGILWTTKAQDTPP